MSISGGNEKMENVSAANRISPASGYISAYDTNTDAQIMLYGRFGKSRYEILYDVTLIDEDSRSRQFVFPVKGDFTPLLNIGFLNKLGKSNLSVHARVGKEKFYFSLLSDSRRPGNALFRTSNGFRGEIINTQSSWWEAVAVVAICALAGVTLHALDSEKSLSVTVDLDAKDKEASVNVEVGPGREDPDDGSDSNDGDDPDDGTDPDGGGDGI
jgi:hypothetical protein